MVNVPNYGLSIYLSRGLNKYFFIDPFEFVENGK